jgi:copper resistance protein D
VIDWALAAARAVHFAATLLLEGGLAFRVLVAGPMRGGDARSLLRSFDRIAAGAFVVAILSGAAWLLLLAAELGGSSVADALSDGTAWLLLTQTQFGMAWQARAAAFLLLAICMVAANRTSHSAVWQNLGLLLSIALAGSIAWSGHAAATPGALGNVHLALDFLHLTAAGLWVGGLLPFTILLLKAKRDSAHRLSRRFSTLATASVLILLPTGIANGWLALSGLEALTGTLYGRLLLAKIGLFLLMLAFAAVNRFMLTPQLPNATLRKQARTRLVIHSGCETALGVFILALVGVLGLLDPAGHDHSMALAISAPSSGAAASSIRLLF